MSLVLDSRQLAKPDRPQALRELIAREKVPLDIDFPPAVEPVVRGTFTDLGALRICACRSNATRVARTPQLARDDFEPSIFVGLQDVGRSLVVQGDREAVLEPGDLVLFDTTTPFTLIDAGGIRQFLVRLPISRLALPRELLQQVCAVRLTPGHPVADLAAAYFRRMASRPDLLTLPGSEAMEQPSIELIRALITTHLNAQARSPGAGQATLGLRVMEFVRGHLADPDLNASSVAAAHHISIRHLYNVLGELDVSLGAWIREQRLEACRTDLATPTDDATIAAIARRRGFVDPSTFGRLFRATYGMSPREWRRNSRAALVDAIPKARA
jgi:AraC-like DNA-binding protein